MFERGSVPPILSYCIPVKNRTDELRATLPANLEANRSRAALLEFIVMVFDEDDEAWAWLTESFAADIDSGYLKVHRSSALDSWHFGRAKNAFKSVVSGRLYSSLDADNFVSGDETALVLELHDRFGQNFLLHHFSGIWGDGTCGRVTLGSDAYRAVGYDETFFPRQFDEFDLMVSALCRFPDLTFVSHLEGGFRTKSGDVADYLAAEGVAVTHLRVPDPRERMPLNPKGADYRKKDPVLSAMVVFNRETCFAKNTGSPERKEAHLEKVRLAGHAMLDLLSPGEALRYFFRSGPAIVLGPNSVPVFACFKDDEQFLEEWLRHYQKIGCGPFFVIDNHSQKPPAGAQSQPDLHVLTPAVGTFGSCKSVWVKAAMKAFMQPGGWAVTVDADEFLDVPPLLGDSVHGLVAAAEKADRRAVPGVLVDMLPGVPRRTGELLRNGVRFPDIFDHHLWDGRGDQDGYASSGPVKWSFGSHWRSSYVIDARFHLFGTVDALRKVPLIRYSDDLRLHQGFHDAAWTGVRSIPGQRWGEAGLLPLRHYKLLKLFDGDDRARLEKQSAVDFVYHRRTTKNLGVMVAMKMNDLVERMAALRTRKYVADHFAGPDFHSSARKVAGARGSSPGTVIQRMLGLMRKAAGI